MINTYQQQKQTILRRVKSFSSAGNYLLSLVLLSLVLLSSCSSKREGEPRILVFSKTSGYHHASIADGNKAIMELGKKNGFEVDTTTNAEFFQEDSLKKYAAVVFLSTTGDVLNHYQEADFERYIQAGGGFVGVHAATDTEYDWGWYGRLVGGYFNGHPEQQQATVHVTGEKHESTAHLPKDWSRKDEWYNFKSLNKDAKVLLTLDEKTYKGGTNGDNHPAAWYHDFEGGRSFYTALGHTEESYKDDLYLQHLLKGIEYAMGDNKELNYEKVTTLRVPEENRFVKTVLTQGKFVEPTEMAILPNLDVLVAQRRGELMLYSQENGSLQQAGFLDVYHTSSSDENAEEGLMGLAVDPNFKNNNFVFLYYSPADTSVNRLSRFVFKNGKLDMASEKIILQLYSQRQICCHTGGSIAFGPDNLLYLSTGDNSTPFDEKGQKYTNQGYAPLDARSGHAKYDARRSSGNTNDLRGKIIRIKVKEDGTYEIPNGNLFSKQAKARPEIYTMGHRNPYRISVDPKTGFLYWGEVGPDAKNDSLATRGPKGYDEVNQARKAGNYGWPLFVGNNYAYHQYDYGTGTSGPAFNPAKPVNNSPNNTGLVNLPPAQPAFIWYPYDASPDFPQVGTGGRNAMAGPVYYTDLYPESTRYAEYYNGKLFIYDWIRDWIKVVTMKPNGDFDKMEPFMEHEKFAAIMDMAVGPDGKIYVLEYGKGWFTGNPDAALSRIDYLAGNRPPKIESLTVDKQSGSLPFTVSATVEVKDPEKDRLKYIWTVAGSRKLTDSPKLEHTFTKEGDYDIQVEVIDAEKATTKSQVVTVYAGNEEPNVVVALPGNQSFYFAGVPVKYHVFVSTPDGQSVDPANLFVSADYVEGKDLAGASMGHQVASAALIGKSLMENSDCKSCHKIEEKSIGPAFVEVSRFYQKKSDTYSHLTNKIIKGGGGVWGENAMPAHPDMSEAETRQIITWIMSLAGPTNTKKSLPAKGEILPAVDAQKKDNTVLKLSATYTNKGENGRKPLMGSGAVQLRSNRMESTDFAQVKGFTTRDSSGLKSLVFPSGEGWLKEQLDLTNISTISFAGVSGGTASTYAIEVRIGAANGRKIGGGRVALEANRKPFTVAVPVQVPLNTRSTDVYIICKEVSSSSKVKPTLKFVTFNPNKAPATNHTLVAKN